MRRVLASAAVGVVLLVAVGTWLLVRAGDDEPAGLTVTWSESEEHPACVYEPGGDTARAAIAIDGSVAVRTTVLITVTAYADENTSDLVGTGTRSVPVEGTVHETVRVTIPVDRPPHLDEDGVAACALDVQH